MGRKKKSTDKKKRATKERKFTAKKDGARTKCSAGKKTSIISLEKFKDLEAVHSHLGPNSRIEIVTFEEEPSISTDQFGFPRQTGQV